MADLAIDLTFTGTAVGSPVIVFASGRAFRLDACVGTAIAAITTIAAIAVITTVDRAIDAAIARRVLSAVRAAIARRDRAVAAAVGPGLRRHSAFALRPTAGRAVRASRRQREKVDTHTPAAQQDAHQSAAQ
jgi:hypothetical protein